MGFFSRLAQKVGGAVRFGIKHSEGISRLAHKVGSVASKVGNVATGVATAMSGNPIGAVAGAVAGGVSAISDYIGGKEKQKRQTPAPTQLQAPRLQPQAQAPISAQQSGGVALSSYN